MALTFPPTQRSEITQLLEGHTLYLRSSFLTATCISWPSSIIYVVPKYPEAEKRAFSSHWPLFLTHPRSKAAGLEEISSFEGTEVAFECPALVRLTNQTKEKRHPISARAKSHFLGMAIPAFSYRRILNKGKAEFVLRIQTRLCTIIGWMGVLTKDFAEQLKKAIDDVEIKAPSGGTEYSLIF